ncbi:MAG: methylglutaconyl-CoA hydratase [Chthoniobacter sp.]|nr:methylglutaconyl-CoA hydratase [Chthoniobacter sp.]
MNGVERITLPVVLNRASVRELAADLQRVSSGSAPVVVIEGRDGTFCRGLDLAMPGSADARTGIASLVECLHMLRQLAKPTIALVDGVAIGGGVGLAAACDLVIASERATFGLPELLYGFVPAIVLPFLLERLSPQKLRLAGLSARTFSAAEAVACGLADVLPSDPPAELRAAVRRFSRAQPSAVEKWKAFSAPPRSHAGLDVTAATLEDPSVARRVQTFLSDGTAPWLQDCND